MSGYSSSCSSSSKISFVHVRSKSSKVIFCCCLSSRLGVPVFHLDKVSVWFPQEYRGRGYCPIRSASGQDQ